MNTARLMLQIPISQTLKNNALAAANDLGFSSLQDLVRLLLTKIAKREITVNIASNAQEDALSKTALARYDRLVSDVVSGKVKTINFDHAHDAVNYLDSV